MISQYVPLSKNNKANCPFHKEKTPSFQVNADKQFFYCFGCGAGGNAISFLMQHQNLSFVEAVEALARKCGLEVIYEQSTASSGVIKDRHKRATAILDYCAKYYCECLEKNDVAKRYINQRKITPQVAQQFMLGYAPNNSDHIKRLFATKYNEDELLKMGILNRNESNAAYPRFRNRIMFPIRNRLGQVIAFGGRILPPSQTPAKYMNSPETEIFHKRNELYGVYEIRQAMKYDRIIVVEGYMDVVALACHDIRNVLATLGTACNREHIKKIFRIAPHIVFCFDGDSAGYKAAVRAMEQALKSFSANQRIDFMFLPDELDPDSFVSERGADAFIEETRKAKPLADFLIDHCLQDLDLSNPAHSADFAQRAYGLISQLPGGIFRDKMYASMAQILNIDVEKIHQYYAQTSQIEVASKPAQRQSLQLQYATLNTALRLLLQHPEFAQLVSDVNSITHLKRENIELFVDMLTCIKEHQLSATTNVIERYRDTEHHKTINQLLVWESKSADIKVHQQEFIDAFAKLKKEAVKQEVAELRAHPALSSSEGQRLIELLKQISDTANNSGR